MAHLRINLPEELDKEFRTIIASKYGYSKGALSLATQDAILKWIIKNGKEPWLYIDSNMSIDLHKDLIPVFFENVIEILNPKKIVISFQASPEEIALISKIFENFELDGEDIFLNVNQSDFPQIFNQLIKILRVDEKHSLLIELDHIRIIGGGAGCLNICGDLSPRKYNQIILKFLKELNIKHQLNLDDKKNFQLILLNPNSKLIEIYENG